jgi:antitoxin component YwqK of YwqJK toxin-antitoxin module
MFSLSSSIYCLTTARLKNDIMVTIKLILIVNVLFGISLALNHEELSGKINQWWSEISLQKPLKCQSEVVKDGPETSAKKIMSEKKLEVYNCTSKSANIPYSFSGKKWLEGSGKLKFRTKTKSEMELNGTDSGICIKVGEIFGNKIHEIVGTFVNGTLEGQVKIICGRELVVITGFKNGKFHGFYRSWDSNGTLMSSKYYQDGVAVGQCWRKYDNYIVYHDCSEVNLNSDVNSSLAFKINASETYSGDFSYHLDLLENIQKVTLTSLNDKFCSITDLKWKNEEKMGSKLVFQEGGILIPDKYQPLCDIIKTTKNPVENLVNWHNTILARGIRKTFINLWQQNMANLKPVDEEKSIKFIREIKPDLVNYTRILQVFLYDNTNATKYYLVRGGFDLENRLHGICEINLMYIKSTTSEDDKTLGWRPEFIRGRFIHGLLEGIAEISMQYQISWAFLQKSVFHGPMHIHGSVPILPVIKKKIFVNLRDSTIGVKF